MSEEMPVSYCSPTLSGLKTGSLFSCPCDSKKKMSGEISNFNQKLSKKGIRILPVRISGRRALIYVYRPEKLKQDFFDEKVQTILAHKGYDCTNQNRCVCRLVEKLRNDSEFPHEIGLFLGYPAEDVKGFIENKATAIPLALDGGLRYPKAAACVILTPWEHGNQKSDTNIYSNIILFLCASIERNY